MDADLETVAHGGHVPAETTEAATIVLAGGKGGRHGRDASHPAPASRRPGLQAALRPDSGRGVARSGHGSWGSAPPRPDRRRRVPLGADRGPHRRRRPGRRPLRRRDPRGAGGECDQRRRARSQRPAHLELGCRGGARVRTTARRGISGRPELGGDDRRLVRQAGSERPERRRSEPRQRCRRAHAARGSTHKWPR